MKYSIKRQLMAVFLGLIVMLVSVVTIINSSFLEGFYISNKMDQMIDMYEFIDEAVRNNTFQEESVRDSLQEKSERGNISITVVSDSGEVIFYTEQEQKGPMFSQLFGYMIGKNPGDELESTEYYKIYKTDSFGGAGENLEMFGTISDGFIFLMQSPIESIRDSVKLANQFLFYIGMISIMLGTVFVWFFSNRITKPIQELTALSQRMANLDFKAKYQGGGNNEIEVLGQNFNTMSNQLERTITELKKANQQLQRDIEQKEKSENMRSEFLGNVSHELKTPIALIQGYAEGLRDGISDDPESREFYCEVIVDEANKMNKMVANLLVLNQLEFGSQEIEVERFDIVKLISGVIASCEIMIQQAEIEIDFIADEEAYVWADESKTEQVIRNYLTNAIHHAAGEKRVEIRVIQKEETVRIEVFNSGNPIPEEDLEKIWQRFYKVDKAHTREYGGNGIGLSIVKAIMESFHQDYGVQNYKNGVKFWFELDAKNNEI